MVMLFRGRVLPCESNLCAKIGVVGRSSAVEGGTYFGGRGRLMVSFSASSWPGILLT